MKHLVLFDNFLYEGHWKTPISMICNDCGYQWKGFEDFKKTTGEKVGVCPECMSDNIDYDHTDDQEKKKNKK